MPDGNDEENWTYSWKSFQFMPRTAFVPHKIWLWLGISFNVHVLKVFSWWTNVVVVVFIVVIVAIHFKSALTNQTIECAIRTI